MSEIHIGIVTPSFNQGQFLEETIDSVLAQNYPLLDYAIIDGGSTDNSLEIIKKYEKYLAFWVSEQDEGQSSAINKGLRRLRGNVWAYLNSDDTYAPETFAKVAEVFRQQQDVKWVTGRGIYVDLTGRPCKEMNPVRKWDVESVLERLIAAPIIVAAQVSNFMATSIIDQFGYFDESLHYAMDVDFGLRPLLAGIRPVLIDEALGRARLHPASKTITKGQDAFAEETALVLKRLLCTAESKYRPAIANALKGYQRQKVLADVRSTWQGGGRTSGIAAWARAAKGDRGLVYNRPALGLLRRIIG
jgi:glycosyltransferase involved in cell wall biosynthesis